MSSKKTGHAYKTLRSHRPLYTLCPCSAMALSLFKPSQTVVFRIVVARLESSSAWPEPTYLLRLLTKSGEDFEVSCTKQAIEQWKALTPGVCYTMTVRRNCVRPYTNQKRSGILSPLCVRLQFRTQVDRALDTFPDTILNQRKVLEPKDLDQAIDAEVFDLAGVIRHLPPVPPASASAALPRRTLTLQWGSWVQSQRISLGSGDYEIVIDLVGHMATTPLPADVGRPLLVLSCAKHTYLGLTSVETTRYSWSLPPPSWLQAPRRGAYPFTLARCPNQAKVQFAKPSRWKLWIHAHCKTSSPMALARLPVS